MSKKVIPIISCVIGAFAFLTGGIFIGMNIKKTNKSDDNSNDDPRYQIYLKAKDAGYSGTYQEWLDSIRGDEVELRVADNYIQMKYKTSSLWGNLLSLDELKGSDGKDGVSIKSQLQVSDGYIQFKNENETTWTNLIALTDLTGDKGEKLELNVNNGFINYKYENDTDWVGLIELSTLTGANGKDGKEVTMSVESDYIVWKYNGETSWNNLISLETLKGDKGETGDKGEKSMMQVSNGFIQWKNENDSEWTNLVSIDTLTGSNGKDGKEVTMSVESDYIVWKYNGETSWNNLISLETLKGDKGDSGRGIVSCEISDGNLIIHYSDGTSQNVGKINSTEEETEMLEYILLIDDTYGVRISSDSWKSKVTNVSIPSSYEGKSVTQILPYGFSDCTVLQQVSLPNTITIIGEGAFSGCSILGNVELPSGLVKIGRAAFKSCANITEATLSSTVNFIGKEAFYGTSLSSIAFTNQYKMSNGSEAFESYFYNNSIDNQFVVMRTLGKDFSGKNLLSSSGTFTYSSSGINPSTYTVSYNLLTSQKLAECLRGKITMYFSTSYSNNDRLNSYIVANVYMTDLII